jgi:ribosomal 50S subunit-recycling heat shock protein
VRLDVFLKRTGLVKQRTLAKQCCDSGQVTVDGRDARAGKEIGPGAVIAVSTERGTLEIEVVALPQRNYKRRDGEAFYVIRSQADHEIF